MPRHATRPERSQRPSGPSQRQLRVGELVRRALADVLMRETVYDPELSGASVTVSEVRLSADLRQARVYVLPLGGQNVDEVVDALNRNRSELRRAMNRNVTLKYSPRLTFVPDTSFDCSDATRRLFEQETVRRDIRA
ncbi:MAG: 30S ribosome-binding factor RbfA [Paracoccaceae bacterium]|nr:30S ribosome-binding factor RbfA [Paracoccaceae bacterium]